MTRRNPFVHVGRPPASKFGGGASRPSRGSASPQPSMGASPMEGLSTGLPAAAFAKGGSMPAYHDCPRMDKSHSEHGFASSKDHFCRGGKT